MTFSIAGRCARTGMVGGAISTSSIAVGSRCPRGRAGVGFALAQNIADPRIALRAIELLDIGLDAKSAMQRLIEEAAFIEERQIGIVDRFGNTAEFTGKNGLGVFAGAEGEQCVGIGNILASQEVPSAMVSYFEAHPELHLAERLVMALNAGLEVGGEATPERSANLVVYDNQKWPLVDLRVDWHEEPIAELIRVWKIYEPQMQDYLLRAIDPARAKPYDLS